MDLSYWKTGDLRVLCRFKLAEEQLDYSSQRTHEMRFGSDDTACMSDNERALVRQAADLQSELKATKTAQQLDECLFDKERDALQSRIAHLMDVKNSSRTPLAFIHCPACKGKYVYVKQVGESGQSCSANVASSGDG